MSGDRLKHYAPPEAELPEPEKSFVGTRLYKPGQIAVASIFGTSMLGFWLLGTNYIRLHRVWRGLISIVGGTGLTIVAYHAAYPYVFAEEDQYSLWSVAFLFGIPVGMYVIARYLQADTFMQVLEGGGRPFSHFRLLAVILAYLGVMYFGRGVLMELVLRFLGT